MVSGKISERRSGVGTMSMGGFLEGSITGNFELLVGVYDNLVTVV